VRTPGARAVGDGPRGVVAARASGGAGSAHRARPADPVARAGPRSGRMSTLSVLDAAREQPARVALTDGVFRLTFAELAERVRARMQRLAPLAERPGGTLVAVATDERAWTIETPLALVALDVPLFLLHQRSTAAA